MRRKGGLLLRPTWPQELIKLMLKFDQYLVPDPTLERHRCGLHSLKKLSDNFSWRRADAHQGDPPHAMSARKVKLK
jgi:hypothetical protein